jgi:hypothetical protein
MHDGSEPSGPLYYFWTTVDVRGHLALMLSKWINTSVARVNHQTWTSDLLSRTM